MKTDQMKIDGIVGIFNDESYATKEEFLIAILANRYMKPKSKRVYIVKKELELYQDENFIRLKAKKGDILEATPSLRLRKKE